MTLNTELFQSLIAKEWVDALRIIREKSECDFHEIIESMPDSTFPTALHVACVHSDTPVEIIHLLSFASKRSALVQDEDGHTPLIISIMRSSDEVIRALIKICPQATAIKDNKGRRPIDYAIFSRGKKVIKALLEADPTNMEYMMASSPLFLFLIRWQDTLKHVEKLYNKVPLRKVLKLAVEDSNGGTMKMADVCEIICLLLRCATAASPPKKGSCSKAWLPIHASLQVDCFPCLFYLLMQIYPEYSKCEDCDGNLPIHVFANSSYEEVYNIESICETACIPNKEGRLPLAVATESGKAFEYGLEQLIYGAPTAIRTRDIKTHMLPFMIAGMNKKRDITVSDKESDDYQQFATSYSLLMEDPTVVLWFLP